MLIRLPAALAYLLSPRLHLLVILATALSPRPCNGQASIAGTASSPELASIAGSVMKAVTGEPLQSARVVLESSAEAGAHRSTYTDANGHFKIQDIAPGRYRLQVTRTGFVTQGYAQKNVTVPGAEFVLGSGQTMKDLLFRMLPTAVISGEVLNEAREPLPWVSILALRETYADGRLTLQTIEEVTTNDLGRYRLFDLSPGSYYVLAVNHLAELLTPPVVTSSSSEQGRNEGYVPTFFPSTTNFATADNLTLDAGEERSNVDFVLAPVPVFGIRGKVSNANSNHATGTEIVQLYPQEHLPTGSFPDYRDLVDEKTGEFRITNVPAGSYCLVASWYGAGGVHYTRQLIEVSSDLANVDVNILSGIDLSGHVTWDPPFRPEKTEMYAVLSSTDAVPVSKSGVVEKDNSFLIKDLSEGDYKISLYGLPIDAYLKSAQYGQQDVLESGLNLRRASSPLQITLSSMGSRVEGSVVDSDFLPAAGVRFTLLSRKMPRVADLIKEATTDQNGRFILRGIAPGNYRLYSWAGAERELWKESGLVKSFEKQGQEITLNEGERKEVALRLIKDDHNPAP